MVWKKGQFGSRYLRDINSNAKRSHIALSGSLSHVPLKYSCTAERGRAQALMDLMEAEYGVNSANPDSDKQISCFIKYLTSITVFLAQAPNSVNFWVLQKRQPSQFVQKAISDILQSLIQKAYKHIGVFKKVMYENRSLDEPADEES